MRAEGCFVLCVCEEEGGGRKAALRDRFDACPTGQSCDRIFFPFTFLSLCMKMI